MADRTGFRATFLTAISLWVLATLLLIFASGFAVTVAVYIGLGAALQGFMSSQQNLTLEFGEREDLPMRIAIANTGAGVTGAIGPLVGGALAGAFGYISVFATAIAFLTIGGLVVTRYVPEPRKLEI